MQGDFTMLSPRILAISTIAFCLSVSPMAQADITNGPKDYTFNQFIGDTWVSRVTAQYSTIKKRVCVDMDLGSCTRWENKSVQALFLKIVANPPSCPNHNHLAGHVKAKFTTPQGGVAYAQVNLTADNEAGHIDEWRNVEGYYGPLNDAKVTVEVESHCDRNNIF
jgi:hypothetical protein